MQVDGDARVAAVAALVALARSADYRDRVDAGRGLASFAEMPAARDCLSGLVLDAGDTFVTLTTAEALLGRKDPVGLAIVAAGLADADDNHADWIQTAAHHVFRVFAEERDAAVRLCNVLAAAEDGTVRRGADDLIDILLDIRPLLHPADDGDR